MSAEIELKLAVAAEQVAPLLAWLEHEAGPAVQQTLRNIYLDTPDLALHRQRTALRLREVSRGGSAHWVQTLKTAGRSVDGLAMRNEWECSIAAAALEPDRFPAPARAVLQSLATSPAPIFRTDFTRHTWRVAAPGGTVEIAFDDGAVTLMDRADGAALPIRELELEWLGADGSPDTDPMATAVTGLRAVAARLDAAGPFEPSDASKAERGYQLYLEHQRS